MAKRRELLNQMQVIMYEEAPMLSAVDRYRCLGYHREG